MTAVASLPGPVVELACDGGRVFDIPAEAHSLAGFREWVLSDEVPEKLRVSFPRGRVTVDISKEELYTHSLVKSAIALTIGNLIESLDFGDLLINGVLLTNVAADVSNNPDMVAVSWNSLDSGKVRFVETNNERAMEIEGSPDWALEIVSASSATKDNRDLRLAYQPALPNTGSSTLAARRSLFVFCIGEKRATSLHPMSTAGCDREFSASSFVSLARRVAAAVGDISWRSRMRDTESPSFHKAFR